MENREIKSKQYAKCFIIFLFMTIAMVAFSLGMAFAEEDYAFPLELSNAPYPINALDRYTGGSTHFSYINEYYLGLGAPGNGIVVDIGAAEGTPIHAVQGGTVKESRYLDGNGNFIVIKHDDNNYSCYNHMKSRSPYQAGQRVEKNAIIGYVGHTGYANGSHLHFEWTNHDPGCMFLAAGYCKLGDIAGHPACFHKHFSWSTPTILNENANSVTFGYRCDVSRIVQNPDEFGCIITLDGGETITRRLPCEVNVTNKTYSGSISTQTMNIPITPDMTYTCEFYVQYFGEYKKSPPLTFTTKPYKYSKIGTGKYFTFGDTLTISDLYIIEDNGIFGMSNNSRRVYTANPGDTFPILDEKWGNGDGEYWYKVQYGEASSKVGWVKQRQGSVFTPVKKQIHSVNINSGYAPIHKSYLGEAPLISTYPKGLTKGAEVTVLGQFINKYNNRWYYVIDSHGHKGWIWSDYFDDGSGACMDLISCPEPGEDAIKAIEISIPDNRKSGNVIDTNNRKAVEPVFTGVRFNFYEPALNESDAFIGVLVRPNGYPAMTCTWTRSGVRLWNAETGEELPLNAAKDQTHRYSLNQLKIQFDTITELDTVLDPATTYTYQFYVECNGKEFWSEKRQFTTTGQKKCTITFESNGGSTIAEQTRRYNSTFPLPKPVMSGYLFMGWYRDAAFTIPFTDTSLVDGDLTLYAAWEREQPIVPVTGVTLDQTAASMMIGEDVLSLNAGIEPQDATQTSVHWSTSNPDIANVDQYGHVVAIRPGSATITCASVETPEISASCEVTVRQKMEFLYLKQDDISLFGEETLQLETGCLPASATERALVWTSGDETVATVSEDGLVCAVAPGQTIITVRDAATGSLSASCHVTVEKNLSLTLNVNNAVFYRGGQEAQTVATVMPSIGSMTRHAGQDCTWQVEVSGDCASLDWDAVELSTLDEQGRPATATGLRLRTTALNAAGEMDVTVTCQTGDDSDSVQIHLSVLDAADEIAGSATLGQTLYEIGVGDDVTIPAVPLASDGGVIPDGISLRFEGSTAFRASAEISDDGDGTRLTFTEPGIFEVQAVYEIANVRYAVPVTFIVADENGVVHLNVASITVTPERISMQVDDIAALTAVVAPENAWNRTLVWTSSDEAVATVDESGVVTAQSPGSAVVTATAADGSDISASTVIMVERGLQLTQNALSLDVYTEGTLGGTIGYVSVTPRSFGRAMSTGTAFSWSLSALSDGETHTVLGLDEYTGGVGLRLMDIRGTGEDRYVVRCESGDYADECEIAIHVRDSALPEQVTLRQNAFSVAVNETLTINAAPQCQPAIPGGTRIELEGGVPFTNGVAQLDYEDETVRVVFAKPGIYHAAVAFIGTNFRYEVPVTITVVDESGNAPVMATAIALNAGRLDLSTGDTAVLAATLTPDDPTDASLNWQSANGAIATVSENGTVTAMGCGDTNITCVNPASGLSAVCHVHVEDALTIETGDLELEVFTEGSVRVVIAEVMLTEASSKRLGEAPEWTLKRVSGNNLTLKAIPMTIETPGNDPVYGASIQLYSISAVGETAYELTCSSNGESDTIEILVSGVHQAGMLPSSVTVASDTCEASVNEIIRVSPEFRFFPENTSFTMPLAVEWRYNSTFAEALNAGDCCFSTSVSTFSFHDSGVYRADLIVKTGNVRYAIPYTFRISDENGDVPVNGESMRLNASQLELVLGESRQLSAVFTPEDATDRTVTWTSSDETVVTVDATGYVTAVGNGTADILCEPSDEHVRAVSCHVVVEDYLTFADGTETFTLYLQGKQNNAAGSVLLTGGTLWRAQRDGLEPEWTLERLDGEHADLRLVPLKDGSGVRIETTALKVPGEDTYAVRCRLGDKELSRSFSLTVLDAGGTEPTSLSISETAVETQVGTPVEIDFTPLCSPEGSALSEDIRAYYVGLGNFYEALDNDNSRVVDSEDHATVCFHQPGVYLLNRYYVSSNLRYAVQCAVYVDTERTAPAGLLHATETEYTLYAGGRSGYVTAVSLSDDSVATIWGDAMEWTVRKLSGTDLLVDLQVGTSDAKLFAADAPETGESVWRVECSFGGFTDYIDVTIRIASSAAPIPEAIRLENDILSGTTGEWLVLPLGVACQPEGSRLPENGDAFWHFLPDARAETRSVWEIKDRLFRISFVESGYYSGMLRYENGNIGYDIPVSMIISDEEGVLPEPDLSLTVVNAMETVYPEGDTDVTVATAVLSEGLSAYNAGTATAYSAVHVPEWSIEADGAAAVLSLRPAGSTSCDILLDAVRQPGDVAYTVTCQVGEKTYQATGALHVAGDSEARPDATQKHSVYYAVVGQSLSIDRNVYSRDDGSLLQSSTEWDASALLSAIGYRYETEETAWNMTFYQAGTFQSAVTAYVGNLRVAVPLVIHVRESDQPETPRHVLRLPEGTRIIEAEAFFGTVVEILDLRDTAVEEIEANAFGNCVDLETAYLPGGEIHIADNAFRGCLNLTIAAPSGSSAQSYALSHSIAFLNTDP